MASIVDKPKVSKQVDLLEIEKYTNGLINFIKSSDTPITIGVQGEWGSGKTLREDLCGKHGAEYYSIWLNTWEYSLLSSPDETLIKIISGLVQEIGNLTKDSNAEKGKKATAALGSLIKNFGGFAGGIGGKIAEMSGEALENYMSENPIGNSIKALRAALQVVIDEAIEKSDKKAFIFFIDDLDRLDPAVAVNILELIKNLFDLEKCIFVLAIDYGVVVKGLQSKFGVMTEENEWEFRAFFDKIIQLPFSMPISNYNIEKYLKTLLIKVEYFSESELEDSSRLNKIVEIVNLSVGTNPRALKRLANSIGLIEIIRAQDEGISPEERVIEFALICIQIAYPIIYGLIQKESDFTTWDDQIVNDILKNKKIDLSDLDGLVDSDEFDDDWEQNVWKICQINSFLKQRSYQISQLLNLIKDEVSKINEEDFRITLDKLLRMSSVTSVSADSIATGAESKFKIPRRKLAFANNMEAFLEDNIGEKYSNYLEDEHISEIKIIPRKDTGSIFLSIKKDRLDFNFVIWTDYSKIHIYVNNNNGNKNFRKATIDWFQKFMKPTFNNMKSYDGKGRKNKVVVLNNIVIEPGLSREDAFDEYKKIIEDTLDKFLPLISKYVEE